MERREVKMVVQSDGGFKTLIAIDSKGNECRLISVASIWITPGPSEDTRED